MELLLSKSEKLLLLGSKKSKVQKFKPTRKNSILIPTILLIFRTFLTSSRPSTRPSSFQSLPDHSLKVIGNLSDPDQILNFNRPDSLLSKILIPRPVESENLTLCRSLFSEHFRSISMTIDLPEKSMIFKNSEHAPSYSSERVKTIQTWELEIHEFTDRTPYGDKSFKSMIFTHDPTAPLRMVLAAHIDSKFFPDPPDNQFVGATDSAAPVAIILEVAKSLSPLLDQQLIDRIKASEDEPQEDRITLQVVLLDGEEAFKDWSNTDSIYGARALAKKWSTPLRTPTATSRLVRSIDEIQVFVLLDLLGSKEPLISNYYLETGWIFDLMQNLEKRLEEANVFKEFSKNKVDISSDEKRRPFFAERKSFYETSFGHIEDDHLPFLRENVPILHLISSPFPRVWHQLGDDRSALDYQTILEWNSITQATLIEYFGLGDYLEPNKNFDHSQRQIRSIAEKDELVI